jgi:hypothetical protein
LALVLKYLSETLSAFGRVGGEIGQLHDPQPAQPTEKYRFLSAKNW